MFTILWKVWNFGCFKTFCSVKKMCLKTFIFCNAYNYQNYKIQENCFFNINLFNKNLIELKILKVQTLQVQPLVHTQMKNNLDTSIISYDFCKNKIITNIKSNLLI